MKGGHNRRTVSEHLQSGTLRPGRHGERLASAEAHKPKKPPTCPRELTGEARKLWRSLVGELANVLGPTDGPTLALLCVTHAELMRSAMRLATLEPGSEDHARLSRSMRGQHETYAKLAEKFGLSPVDRERLPVPTTGEVGGVVRW
jgi:phage terminase small subunit